MYEHPVLLLKFDVTLENVTQWCTVSPINSHISFNCLELLEMCKRSGTCSASIVLRFDQMCDSFCSCEVRTALEGTGKVVSK